MVIHRTLEFLSELLALLVLLSLFLVAAILADRLELGLALLLNDRLALGVGGALLLQLLPALLLVLRLALLLRLLPALLVLQTGRSRIKNVPMDPEYGFEAGVDYERPKNQRRKNEVFMI
jgi:hypothetical protein